MSDPTKRETQLANLYIHGSLEQPVPVTYELTPIPGPDAPDVDDACTAADYDRDEDDAAMADDAVYDQWESDDINAEWDSFQDEY